MRNLNSSVTQLKVFFGAFGACDFRMISYCSWAKRRFPLDKGGGGWHKALVGDKGGGGYKSRI